MRTVRLLIEYDGTEYAGWQAQANGPSVQSEVERALHKVTGQRVRVSASGRTDAGVHALGQVASFRIDSPLPAERFGAALNAHLPRDIVVLASSEAGPDFHARKGARHKTYLYRILNRRVRPAVLRGKAYHFAPRLDVEAMRAAAARLVGKHDFRAFTPPRSERLRGYVREIHSLQVERVKDEVTVAVTGSGFLHNMVRILVGTLIEVGRGKLDAADVSAIIASRDRSRAGPTVPPCGLYLVSVDYGEGCPSA